MGTGVGEAIFTAMASAAATAVVTQAMAPSPKTILSNVAPPEVKPVVEQPDPLAQQQAKQNEIIRQMSRSGRASTILTQGAGTLGG